MLPPDDEQAWEVWASHWDFEPETIYLNHGSFGPPPAEVRHVRRFWQDQMEREPMKFFARQMETAWREARRRLASFVGAAEDRLALMENATMAMNVVASSFPLTRQSQILLTDHEYGAVQLIWQRACRRAGAEPPRLARLPQPVRSAEEVVEAIFAAVTPDTSLIVVSHITSPTAITLPVEVICQRAASLGIPVCVDGPHAVGQLPLAIDRLGCAFYTASCHKWLSAAFGSGFLYVAEPYQAAIEPLALSWGRLRPQIPEHWSEEFIWSGTRDVTAQLTIPAAIQFLESAGLEAAAARSHYLARYARQRLTELTGREPLVPDLTTWYGSMAHVPLPPVEAPALQQALYERHRIEVPIVDFQQQQFIRVSCHLYNNREQIDRLVAALSEEIDPTN